MPGIFPDASTGGVTVRNTDGTPVTPVSGEPPNVYRPAAAFVMTCQQTAVPVATCAQPPAAAQINMLTSQLLALAECWSATGPYDCTDPAVMCDLFSLWVANTLPGLIAASGVSGALVASPATTIDPAIPTTRYGDNTAYLAGPVRWVSFTVPGIAGFVTVPSYS